LADRQEVIVREEKGIMVFYWSMERTEIKKMHSHSSKTWERSLNVFTTKKW
jgi:hypothetical protein